MYDIVPAARAALTCPSACSMWCCTGPGGNEQPGACLIVIAVSASNQTAWKDANDVTGVIHPHLYRLLHMVSKLPEPHTPPLVVVSRSRKGMVGTKLAAIEGREDEGLSERDHSDGTKETESSDWGLSDSGALRSAEGSTTTEQGPGQGKGAQKKGSSLQF